MLKMDKLDSARCEFEMDFRLISYINDLQTLTQPSLCKYDWQ